MPVHALFQRGQVPQSTLGMSTATVRRLITEGWSKADLGGNLSLQSQQGPPVQGGPGDWRDLIREGIEFMTGRWFPEDRMVSMGIQDQEPIRDLPVVPDWIDRMLSGTIPRGGVPYISMPDGTTGCPSGYHPEKQGKGYCVRNRRMNSLNPRALSRASRRVGGFARAVKRARTLKKVCRSL